MGRAQKTNIFHKNCFLTQVLQDKLVDDESISLMRAIIYEYSTYTHCIYVAKLRTENL